MSETATPQANDLPRGRPGTGRITSQIVVAVAAMLAFAALAFMWYRSGETQSGLTVWFVVLLVLLAVFLILQVLMLDPVVKRLFRQPAEPPEAADDAWADADDTLDAPADTWQAEPVADAAWADGDTVQEEPVADDAWGVEDLVQPDPAWETPVDEPEPVEPITAGCPGCGTVFEITEAELQAGEFSCRNCGRSGYVASEDLDPASIQEEHCTSCGATYAEFMEHSECPNCHTLNEY